MDFVTPRFPNFHPGCEVTIWHKTRAGGEETVYKITSIKDPTNTYLSFGDNGGVTVSKGLYDPAGQFQITLPDMPLQLTVNGISARDSLYGFIEPMDRIEIRMNRDQMPPGEMPVVLRGFVRGVGREETMDGEGRPQRTLVISGHDFGCAFSIQQIGVVRAYLENLPAYEFSTIAGLLAAISTQLETGQELPIGPFVQRVTEEHVNPILQEVGAQFTFDLSMAPTDQKVFLQTAISIEGPIWNWLYRLIDTPWNEMFVREGPNNPEVVVRRTPWLLDSAIASMPTADSLEAMGTRLHVIEMQEVMELRAHRDDSDVTNILLINNWEGSMFGTDFWRLEGRDYMMIYTPDSGENAPSRYGHRIAQLYSMLMPTSAQSKPEGDFEAAKQQNETWMERERFQWLLERWGRNADWEHGSIQIRGRSDIRVGEYIHVMRGMGSGLNRVDWAAYVTRVTHQYTAFRQYTTTLEYIRSNQYVRRRNADSPWNTERRRHTA